MESNKKLDVKFADNNRAIIHNNGLEVSSYVKSRGDDGIDFRLKAKERAMKEERLRKQISRI